MPAITDRSTKTPLLKTGILNHGTLHVRDIAKSRRFYEEVLGIECIQTSPLSLMIRKGTAHVYAVVEQPAGIHPPMTMLNHNGFEVGSLGEVEAAHELIATIKEEYGIKKVMPISHMHGDASFYFMDQDDNWWEIVHVRPGGYVADFDDKANWDLTGHHEVAEWVDLFVNEKKLRLHYRPGLEAGLGTDTLSGARAYCVPLGAGLGVVAFTGREDVPLEQRAVLQGLTRQAAVAFERLRLAEEARSAALRARTEEMRSALLSTISHDLRTPLAVVTGAATALKDEASLDGPTRRSLVETICDEAERLERLVRNLLDMTRVQAGALKVKREWVPLEEIIGSARARLAKQLSGRTVHVELPETLTLVAVDPLLFEQVLLNLLENAVKYTPPGSPIDMMARVTATGIELEVCDRGPGFDPQESERLFEKFYRGARSIGGGAGLGLAVSRGIVEAHGGRISAVNRPGGGASFVVSLPSEGTPPLVPEEDAA